MIVKYSSKMMDLHPEAFSLISQSYFKSSVNYFLSPAYRKSTKLSPWLEEQVKNPSPAVIAFAAGIDNSEDYDELMLDILRAVKRNILYKGDITHWKYGEYWATANETLTGTSIVSGVSYGPMEGDCEDGAILMYVVARLKGIPINRLMVMAGDVIVGGHCWLAYRAKEYPLNWMFMDWCYNPSLKDVYNRNVYYIKNEKIYGWFRDNEELTGTDMSYQKIWFGFNEIDSHYRFNFSNEYRDLK